MQDVLSVFYFIILFDPACWSSE